MTMRPSTRSRSWNICRPADSLALQFAKTHVAVNRVLEIPGNPDGVGIAFGADDPDPFDVHSKVRNADVNISNQPIVAPNIG